MALSYGSGLFYFGLQDNQAGFWAVRAVAAAIWLGFAAWLALRRDLVGAYAVSAVYILFDAWMWFAKTS